MGGIALQQDTSRTSIIRIHIDFDMGTDDATRDRASGEFGNSEGLAERLRR